MTVRTPMPVAAIAFAATLAAACQTGGDTLPSADTNTISVTPANPSTGAPPGGPESTPGCRPAPVTGDGIGPVQVGMTVDALRSQCSIVRDTTVLGPEGHPSQVVSVALGADTLDVEVVDGKVWRIPVTAPVFRTADAIGVGTPLARLLELEGVTPAMGEGTYVMAPSHCGISFQIADPAGSMPPVRTEPELRALPATVRVTRMLLTGCSGR